MLLEMRGVCKAFDGAAALDDAGLRIDAGEVHAVIGQNGAGKSTLIKILTGVHRKDAGEVLFDGRPVAFASPHEAQQNGVATIYQELNLIPLRSVAENICLGREPKRWGMIDTAAMKKKARAALERLGVDFDVSAPLETFGSASRQLVAIARAVSLEAKLVVMDEPTSSLDAREAEFLFGAIRGLKNDGASVLYITHFLDELHKVCDSVTVMRDGKRVRSLAVRDADKLELVADMLGRDVEEVRRAGMTGFGESENASGNGRELLSVRGLQSKPRIKNVGFTVREKEIVGLGGLLGAGRSETARAIFAADKIESGDISLSGEGPAGNPRDAILKGMGYLTEDRKVDGIIPDMSVRENITLALLPKLAKGWRIDRRREKEIADDFVRQLGIKLTDTEQPIRQLSGGNQQKALLAKWFAVRPKVLLLDEPTRGVDVGAKREIQVFIRRFADEGNGVLMISSEFEELAEGADRVVVMHEGESVGEMQNPGITEESLVGAVAGGAAK